MSPAARARPRAKAARRPHADADAQTPPPLLMELLKVRGTSGRESTPAALWRRAAGEFARVDSDIVGSPVALVAPAHGFQEGARRLLVMGHIDEIGLMVTYIDDDGYLWFGEVGGWDPQILVGQRVLLDTQAGALLGVIGRKPIHLLREEERKKVPDTRELYIDIGARDGKQAAEMVRVGDVAVIAAEPAPLPNGRLTARALDNRLGSYVALEAARLVAQAGGAQWELAAVAAAQEETSFGGARTSAFALAPHAAIVVDGTHATDAPGIDVKSSGKHELGSGPVLMRGSTLHEGLFELLYGTAQKNKIAVTVEASARNTGTDADVVHASRAGVPTAVVSIPLRYMHSPVELVQLSDVSDAARLIAATALALTRESSLARP